MGTGLPYLSVFVGNAGNLMMVLMLDDDDDVDDDDDDKVMMISVRLNKIPMEQHRTPACSLTGLSEIQWSVKHI